MAMGKWVPIKTPDAVKAQGILYCAIGAYEDQLYFFGGRIDPVNPFKPQNRIMKYDTATDTWAASQASLQGNRFGISIVRYREALYLFGGQTVNGRSTMIERYVPSADTCQQVGTSPNIQYNSSCVRVGDWVYYAGGRSYNGSAGWTDYKEMYRYNLVSGIEERLADMKIAMHCGSDMQQYNNSLYVFGGWQTDGSGTEIINRTIQRYDMETNTWSIAGELPSDCGARSVQVGNKVYLLGGTANRAYVYDFEADTYTLIADTNYVTSVLALVGNRIYAKAPDDTLEYYEPPEEPVEPTPDPAKGCAKVEIKITGCSGNAVIKSIGRILDETGCTCDCDCSCGTDK